MFLAEGVVGVGRFCEVHGCRIFLAIRPIELLLKTGRGEAKFWVIIP